MTKSYAGLIDTAASPIPYLKGGLLNLQLILCNKFDCFSTLYLLFSCYAVLQWLRKRSRAGLPKAFLLLQHTSTEVLQSLQQYSVQQ